MHLKVENKVRGDALPKDFLWATEAINPVYTSFCSNVHLKKSLIPPVLFLIFLSWSAILTLSCTVISKHIMHKSELKKAVDLFKRRERRGEARELTGERTGQSGKGRETEGKDKARRRREAGRDKRQKTKKRKEEKR